MKTLVTIILATLASSNFASASDYVCKLSRSSSQHGGKNIGMIRISGDPIREEFTRISVNGERKAFKYGSSSNAYLYLFDARTKSREVALEVMNYPTSRTRFWIYVYPTHFNVMGDYKIAAYQCRLDR